MAKKIKIKKLDKGGGIPKDPGGVLDSNSMRRAPGISGPARDINTGKFYNTRLGGSNSGEIVPLPDFGMEQPGPKPRKPIFVDSPNDPRLKAYNDSLKLYNTNFKSNKEITDALPYYSPIDPQKIKSNIKPLSAYQIDLGRIKKDNAQNYMYLPKYDNKGREIPHVAIAAGVYKKPVQPVVYQKPQQQKENPKYKQYLQELNNYKSSGYSPYTPQGGKKGKIYLKTGNGNNQTYLTVEPQYLNSIKPVVPQERKDYPIRGPLPKAQAKIQITAPQQSQIPQPQGDYVYGPANSVIGTNIEGKFTPINMPEQRGKVNQADWDMLNNQESMKKYVQQKGLQYKKGGKLKGNWGASIGTDQFSSGPMPVNPYPNGFNMTMPRLDAQGNPIPATPLAVDNSTNNFGRPSISGGTTPQIAGGVSGGTSTGAAPISGGTSNGTMTGAPPVAGGKSDGTSVGAPPTKGGVSNSDAVKPQPYQSPNVKMPEGKGAEGSGGQALLTGLMAVSALMPKEKIRRRYVRPEDMQSYNPNTYGTGSQALSEYGNTLKGAKKKAFWGAVIGAVAGKAQAHGDESKKNLFNNAQESLAPLMMISDKAQAEATRLDNLYLQGGVQNMTNLQQPQQQFLPNQQAQYMNNGGEMYGDGGELMTGEGGQTELKSYNPYDGGTLQFNGASHEDGGININYKGQPAEVEGQETAFKDQQGDLKIMGNLVNPLTGRKYKDDLKKIANKEMKAQKLIDKGSLLLNTANPDDAFELLSFNSGKAMAMGGLAKQKQLAETKQHLGNMQEAHLEIAKEKQQSPEQMFAKGGTMPDPEPKKKWVYKDTNTKNLDAKIKEFADLLAANGIEGYSGARGGYREGSKTTSGRKSRHARNQALDIIPVAGQDAYQQILKKPELVAYMMNNGLTAINEYDPAIAKKTGATAGHLHIGYDRGTKLADKFRQDAISLYPQYSSEPKYRMNDVKGETYTAKELAAAYGMTPKDIQARIKNGILTALPGVTSQNYKEPALNQGAGDALTENYNGFVNKPYNIPQMNFTPKISPIQTVEGDNTPIDLQQPAPINKPSNARGISPLQFVGEGYALATNREEPVKAQLYTPELFSPYQVSFQDRLNENQATFNSIQKQVAYDPTSLATLAGQKYSANSSVLADEFRTNQGIANDIINKNVALLNDAEKTNLGILDQQYVRQSQAKSNTKKINQDALSSISSKILQKEASNNQLRVLENMYPDYAFNKRTGKAEYYGPDAGSQIDWSGVQPVGGVPSKTQVKTKEGNVTTTKTYDDPTEQWMKSLNLQKKKMEVITPIKMFNRQ